jgi:cell cycle sensor histidine kinase DivJ
VKLSVSVRDYLQSLVHASARHDPLLAARHSAFITPRILGGLTALAALPLYLGLRGVPGPLEIIAFAWLIAPIGAALVLSRTGREEPAYMLSSMALAGLAVAIAAMSGGAWSPVAIWLVVVPLEAALCASRRVVAAAATVALIGYAMLLCLGPDVLGLIPPPQNGSPLFSAVCAGSAIAYATMLALGAGSMARTGNDLLISEEDRYRLLAAHMTDVITRHCRNGAVTFISPAAERVFGLDLRDLMGHGLFDRVHVADRPAFLSTIADTANDGKERAVEFRARRHVKGLFRGAEQHFLWVEMRCRSLDSVTKDASAGGLEVVAVMRDITERKAQEEIVEAARSEAEQANAAKSRFLATMSHELRTPLNAVIGFSEMLLHEESMQLDDAKRHEYARLIHESGNHLLSVVNLVLDMSKIESGNFVITPEPFALAGVVRDCCDLLTLKANDVGLDLVMRLPPDLPEMVADKRALKQVLLNLLSNAVKFTDRGGRVTVSAKSDATHVTVTVQDTGIGIAAEDLSRLGDPFFQARDAYNRPYDGTGLGLSIVKGLVNLHGGALAIESEVGVGTSVTITLPIDCERGTPLPPAESAAIPLIPRLPAASLLPVSGASENQGKKRAYS